MLSNYCAVGVWELRLEPCRRDRLAVSVRSLLTDIDIAVRAVQGLVRACRLASTEWSTVLACRGSLSCRMTRPTSTVYGLVRD